MRTQNAMDDIGRLPPVVVVSSTSHDADHRLRSATIACRQAGHGAVAFSSHWGRSEILVEPADSATSWARVSASLELAARANQLLRTAGLIDGSKTTVSLQQADRSSAKRQPALIRVSIPAHFGVDLMLLAGAVLRPLHDRQVLFMGLCGTIDAALRDRGLDVTVVGRDDRPLQSVLGRDIGDFVRRTHEAHGVRFQLGRRPVAIRGDSVVLDDGSTEQADIVIAAIGVEPDVALASHAGLAVDRGILVSDTLQTSWPNIFAAGDAARFPYARTGKPIRVEHWAVAGRQGQVAARNAIGHRERYAAVPFFWSQHYDLVFGYVGHAERADEVELFGSLEGHNAAAVYRDESRIAAVVTLFRDDISLAVEAAMERNAGDDAILELIRRGF